LGLTDPSLLCGGLHNQAIGSIFVRAPELMLKSHVQTIIRKGLSSESHEVRLQMLLNISDFLAAEEAKALSATAGKNKKTSKKPGAWGVAGACSFSILIPYIRAHLWVQ
jgi:hypothetical protein